MLLTTATTLLVLVAFLVPLALLLRILAVDRAVAEATQDAQNLAVLVAVADPGQLASAVTLLNQRSSRQIGLVLPAGGTLGPSDHGTAASLRLAQAGRSFTATVTDGRVVYVPVDTEAGRAVVRCFVPESLLRRGVTQATLMLIGLAAVLLVLAVAVADRLAVGTVRPLRRLADTAQALSDGDLTARVDVDGPHEVRDLGATVNLLAGRIGELLAAEREIAADLSHRLRTPLTALRLDAEAVDGAEPQQRLIAHIDALEHAVDEVIREARRPMREGVHPHCDAAIAVGERASYWGVLFASQQRPITLDLTTQSVPVRTTEQDLGAAVDVLLQNALVHTSEGVAVTVCVTPIAAGFVEVTVSDEGLGYPKGAELRGWSTAGSTGLGLDIARRTAESSGGRLELGTREGGGARTCLVLGPASAVPD